MLKYLCETIICLWLIQIQVSTIILIHADYSLKLNIAIASTFNILIPRMSFEYWIMYSKNNWVNVQAHNYQTNESVLK